MTRTIFQSVYMKLRFLPSAGSPFSPLRWCDTPVTLRTPACLKHHLARLAARAWFPDLAYFFPPPTDFSTGERKNASEKKSREPENTTRALLRACRVEKFTKIHIILTSLNASSKSSQAKMFTTFDTIYLHSLLSPFKWVINFVIKCQSQRLWQNSLSTNHKLLSV